MGTPTLYLPPSTDQLTFGQINHSGGYSAGATSVAFTLQQGSLPTPGANQAIVAIINPATGSFLDNPAAGGSGTTERVVITGISGGSLTIPAGLAYSHANGETILFGLISTTWLNSLLASANNLSDVADAGTSRANIHVPALAAAAAVATSNIATLSGTGAVIDGYTLASGDIVLLTAQTTPSQNGQWTVNAGAWTRPTDFSTGTTVHGRMVQVMDGADYKGTVWGLGTPTAGIVVDTSAQSWVNLSAPTSTTSALQLSLTETVNYPPTSALKGNTAIIITQNETFAFLPPVVLATSGGAGVQGIYQSGTTWTITFESSILGTLGEVGDTFGCWLTGFTPSAYNIGSEFATVTATITSATTITIPNTTTGSGTLTAWGTVNTLPQQYTGVSVPAGGGAPRAINEYEGTNTFERSVDALYGIGPVVQNAMNYTHGTVYSASTSCTNGSNVYKVTGDVRANLVVGLKLGPGVSGVPTNSYIGEIYYDGTNTNLVAYVAGTGAAANFTGSTGSYALTYPPDIAPGEAMVNASTTYVNGADVSFPVNSSGFAAPGQGQGWYLGYWDGPNFAAENGGSLANVNIANFVANAYTSPGVSGLLRLGLLVGDILALVGDVLAGGSPGSIENNYGVVIGQIQPNAETLLPHVGGATNVGLINAGATATPSGTPFATVTSGPTPPSISAITSNSTSFTVAFASAHSLSAGNTFSLSGVTPSAYNGTWTVASAVGTTGSGGTYTVTVTSTANPGTASVEGSASYLTGYLLANAATPTLTVSTTNGFDNADPSYALLTQAQGLYPVVIEYTGITGTTLTGCSIVSGASTNILTGGQELVWSCNSSGTPSGTFYVTATSGIVLPVPQASMQVLYSTTGSTATVTLSSGAYDGQRILYIVSTFSGSDIALAKSSGTPKVYLSASTHTMAGGAVLELVWSASLGAWFEVTYNTTTD